MKPSVLVVSVYFGNDVYDTYAIARRRPEVRAGVAPALWAAADAAEQQRPLAPEVDALHGLGAAPERGLAPAGFVTYLKLYALARAAWHRLNRAEATTPAVLSRDFARAAAALSTAQRQYAIPVSHGWWRTVLMPAYRGRVMDDSDPRIRAGFEAARYALLTLHDRAGAAGVPALIVLLPTKESVFWPHVREADARAALEPMVTKESRLRAELTAALTARGVLAVDVLDSLRRGPRGLPTHFEDTDGYPNNHGHDVIAVTVDHRHLVE